MKTDKPGNYLTSQTVNDPDMARVESILYLLDKFYHELSMIDLISSSSAEII